MDRGRLGPAALACTALVAAALLATYVATPLGLTRASFALTTGDVVMWEGQPFTANAIFVAPSADPIWEGVTRVELLPDSGAAALPVQTDGYTIAKGDSALGLTIGNLMLDLPPGEYSRIRLGFHARDPVEFEIGSWSIVQAPYEQFVEVVGRGGGIASSCSSDSRSFRNTSGGELVISSVRAEAPGVSLQNVTATGPVASGNVVTVAFDIVCDDTFDLQAFTPRVEATVDGRQVVYLMESLSTGQIGIDDDDVARIASR